MSDDEGRICRLGDCIRCPLGISEPRPVWGYGIGDGIAIVGESPGAQEVRQGRPFVGPSGRLIRHVLTAFGVDPDACYWTNTALCHSDNKPTKDVVVACRGRLIDHELLIVAPKKILALGASAYYTLTFGEHGRPPAISSHHGRGFTVKIGDQDVYGLATYHPAAVLRDPNLFRDFATDIRKFVALDHPKDQPPIEVDVLRTRSEESLVTLDMLCEATVLSCDVETTGLNPARDHLISIGFGAKLADGSMYSLIVPFHLLKWEPIRVRLLKLLNENDGMIVLHNAKFDLKFLSAALGETIRPLHMADTMLMNYTIDERPMGQYKAHGLKNLARMHFDAPNYAFDWEQFYAIEKPSVADYFKLFHYQGKDCAYTLRLYHELRERGYLEFHDTLLIPASIALAEIEARGIAVDRPYLETLCDELHASATETKTRLVAIADPLLPDVDFNPASTEHLKKLLYDVWKLPHLRDPYRKQTVLPTSRDVVSRLAAMTADATIKQFLGDLLEWRSDQKMLRTYAEGILSASDEDGRVRPTFLLHGTSTGRLSCSNPNLQNIPNKIGKMIQHSFVASPGYTLVSCDYSQLEIRIAAWYSQDEELMRIFSEDRDVHGEAASRIYNKPASRVSDLERKLTKTIVFGVIYGRGPKSLVEGQEMTYFRQMGLQVWTIEQAKGFQQKFLDAYPGLHDWIVSQERHVMEKKYVETPIGRRRRFPFITPESRAEIMRQAVNMPIQSLASDVCLNALVKLHRAFSAEPKPRAHVLLAIHDELIFEIRNDAVEDMVPMIRRTMELALPEPLLASTVPFKVTSKWGQRWSELVEK